jgi:hypothetical protein
LGVILEHGNSPNTRIDTTTSTEFVELMAPYFNCKHFAVFDIVGEISFSKNQNIRT